MSKVGVLSSSGIGSRVRGTGRKLLVSEKWFWPVPRTLLVAETCPGSEKHSSKFIGLTKEYFYLTLSKYKRGAGVAGDGKNKR